MFSLIFIEMSSYLAYFGTHTGEGQVLQSHRYSERYFDRGQVLFAGPEYPNKNSGTTHNFGDLRLVVV